MSELTDSPSATDAAGGQRGQLAQLGLKAKDFRTDQEVRW